MDKRIGYGCTLGVDPAGGVTFTTIAAIIDGWSGPDTSADDVETTVLGDKYKTFARAQIDPGTVQFEIAYDPANATNQTLVDLYDSGDVASWQITFNDVGNGSATETFNGYVNSFSREMTKGSLVKATISIKVSGDPGYTGA